MNVFITMQRNAREKKQLLSRCRTAIKRKTLSLPAILEQLESRHMLAGDHVDFQVSLIGSPNSYDADQSYSYNAPWVTKLSQGQDQAYAWKSSSPQTKVGSSLVTPDRIIETASAYRQAIIDGHVAEVSDNLLGCFVSGPILEPAGTATLYPDSLRRAWAMSSDNLYSLLVLNSRDQAAQSPENQQEILVTNRVMQAMQRIVGFGFPGKMPETLNSEPVATTAFSLSIFEKDNTFETVNPVRSVSASGLKIQVPTVRHFFEFTNEIDNGRPLNVHPLPDAVREKLESYYTTAVAGSDGPIEVFSTISGIKNLLRLLEYAPSDSPPVYDAKANPLSDQNPNYSTYQEACKWSLGYYQIQPQASLQSFNTQDQVKSFFDNFAEGRLQAIHNAQTQQVIDQNIEELAIGLRALMAMAYDASPFWSSYGIGYSNAANPMVGQKLSEIRRPENFIDLFNGQEIQLQNIALPVGTVTITPQEPLLQDPGDYPTQGWFKLDTAVTKSGVQNYINTVPDTNYTTNYDIFDSGTAVVFKFSSTSSDTLSAEGIASLSTATTLTPNTEIDIEGSLTKLSDLHPIAGHSQVMPTEFATYISMAGGVDRVTGSNFDDVIIGPSFDAAHGRLTVQAGDGNDVLAPGRGGSLVELGPGADTVVFCRDDLFGITNFLDFQVGQGDRLVLDERIHWEYHPRNRDTIILTDSIHSATKTLRLTPLNGSGGDISWSSDAIETVSLSTDPQKPWDNAGQFSYLETHQFDMQGLVDLSNFRLKVEALDQTIPAPFGLWVQSGNQDGLSGNQKYGLLNNAHVGYLPTQNNGYVWEIPLADFKTSRQFTNEKMIGDFQFSIIPYEYSAGGPQTPMDPTNPTGPKFPNSTGRNFGERQIEIFVNQNSLNSPYPDNSLRFHKTIKTSELGTNIPANDQWSPQTKWVHFPTQTGHAVAYMGGLAKILYENSLYAQSADHDQTSSNSSKSLQLTVDTDFAVGINSFGNCGVGSYNLSSRMAVWDNLDSSQFSKADLDAMVENLNSKQTITTNTDSGLKSLPATTPKIVSLATDVQVLVNGTGRINGWAIHEEQSFKVDSYGNPDSGGTPGKVSRGGTERHPALNEEFPFYFINSDMLAVSSIFNPATKQAYQPPYSVNVNGITVGWPARRGIGPVILQDYGNNYSVAGNDNPLEHSSDGVVFINNQGELGDLSLPFSPTYEQNPVRIANYKQVGGWVDQADGPEIGGYKSVLQNSFIHANDDSIKVAAPNLDAFQNTVLQGNAGNAVGLTYGFVNGSASPAIITDTYIHRISHSTGTGNDYGAIALRVVPAPNQSYLNHLKDLNISYVYIPNMGMPLIGQTNSITTAVSLYIANSIPRGTMSFGPTTPSGTANFDFEVGNIKAYDGWQIYATPLLKDSENRLAYSQITINKTTEFNNGNYTVPTTGVKIQLVDSYSWQLNGTQVKNLTSPPVWATIKEPFTEQHIQLYTQPKIQRPKLYRSSKIYIRKNSNVIGPDPLVLTYNTLEDATLEGTRDSGTSSTFIVSNVASGYVEKKRSDGSWVDVSTPITTSNPRALIQLLRNRMIAPGDEVRWVPGTANEGKASAQAFSLYGWDGVSASVEASEIEVGVDSSV